MPKLTPSGAVLRGHVFVTVPVLAIIVAFTVVGIVRGERAGWLWMFVGGAAGALVGSAIAWIWWSIAIPRWRDWVQDRGLSPADVQGPAVRTGLLWPEGSAFERTEFRRRDGRRGW